jgi:hypothetical protein
MKERRTARRCKNCGEPMQSGAFMCAKCGKATSELYTRLTDPRELRPSRYGPRKFGRGCSRDHFALCSARPLMRASAFGQKRTLTHHG